MRNKSISLTQFTYKVFHILWTYLKANFSNNILLNCSDVLYELKGKMYKEKYFHLY